MTQRNKFKAIVYVFLLVAGVVILAFFWQYNQSKARDYQRLGDLKLMQQTLNDYFFRYNTYQIPGCNPPALVSNCRGTGERLINLGGLSDPLGGSGYQYTIVSLGDDDFEIEFALETDVAGLLKGYHLYTKSGIKE